MDQPLSDALRAAVARMEAGDRALAKELDGVRDRRPADESRLSSAFLESAPQSPPSIGRGLELETIVLRIGRPVLAIAHDRAQLEFRDTESEVWRTRLVRAADRLAQAARAVGRINVAGHPQLLWVGTGWLVDDTTVVTNRHVAREFCRRSGAGFSFAEFDGAMMQPSIDFLQEVDRDDRFELRIVEVLHVEDDNGPDVALLRVEPDVGGTMADPIPLSDRGPSPGAHVAVIGYPARDSRIPDFSLMQSIFGDVYDRKRLAPGQILDRRHDVVTHDCSTLGGNSGSVVLDLADGRAVALHFAGRFLKSNSAVPAALVADRLAASKRRPRPGQGHSVVPPGSAPIVVAPTRPPVPPDDMDGQDTFEEGRPSDYVGRCGYDAAFIGAEVPLPVIANADDVLTFTWENRVEQALAYEHFAVVMSRSRRVCLFSAANLDGGQMRRIKRPSWRIDPRIPRQQQIKEECYGRAPRFSRGHMTRRTDPAWGEPTVAARGNSDSMHVTNTVPQVQPFNAGIWLGLEDYAFDHAVEDAMRISVFTGPFLLADDPVLFGVAIPRSFWKIIVFMHDVTRKLSATAYVMSQDDLLGDREFVFGQHKTWQVAVATVERRAGMSWAGLSEADPFVDVDEGVGTHLTEFGQIAFYRP